MVPKSYILNLKEHKELNSSKKSIICLALYILYIFWSPEWRQIVKAGWAKEIRPDTDATSVNWKLGNKYQSLSENKYRKTVAHSQMEEDRQRRGWKSQCQFYEKREIKNSNSSSMTPEKEDARYFK